MGKKNKNKRKRQQGNNNKHNGGSNKNNGKNEQKRQRYEKYWIEDCKESKKVDTKDAAINVLITRVELTDGHTHHRKSQEKKKEKEGGASKPDDAEGSQQDKKTLEVEGTCRTTLTAATTSTSQTCDETVNTGGDDETSEPAALTTGNPAEYATKDANESQKEEEKKESSVSDSAIMKSVDSNNEVTQNQEASEENNGSKIAPEKDTVVNEEEQWKITSKTTTKNAVECHEPAYDVEGNAGESSCAKAAGSQVGEDKPNEQKICIRKDDSARKKPKKFAKQMFKPLPNGDCGDGITNPFPSHVVQDKYWAQRHRLFSRFEGGIELDRESWFSVTPEAIANHIAAKIIEKTGKSEGLVIVDAFCGAGGNAIALARRPEVALVVCVDLDKEKLQLAARNSKVYEVPDDKLLFLHQDACDVLQQYNDGKRMAEPSGGTDAALVHGYKLGGLDWLPMQIDAVFLSPPWGGADYETIGAKNYDLKCIQLVENTDGEQLLGHSCVAVPSEHGCIAYFLPRNTNGLEVAKSALKAGVSGTMEMEQNYLNHKFKTITIYL